MKNAALKQLVVDYYLPDYARRCSACGEIPTVTGIKNGKVVYVSSMCGSCTFDGHDMGNPKNWNK